MNRNLLFSIIFVIILIMPGCNFNIPEKVEYPTSPEAEPQIVLKEIIRSGCIDYLPENEGGDSNVSIKDCSWYVKSITKEEKLVYIRLHYYGNCCADFADSLIHQNKNADLYLKYVGDICRCNCFFESDFVFDIVGTNRINLKVYLNEGSNENYIAMIDTSLVIP